MDSNLVAGLRIVYKANFKYVVVIKTQFLYLYFKGCIM